MGTACDICLVRDFVNRIKKSFPRDKSRTKCISEPKSIHILEIGIETKGEKCFFMNYSRVNYP